jgi:hypothetical protein
MPFAVNLTRLITVTATSIAAHAIHPHWQVDWNRSTLMIGCDERPAMNSTAISIFNIHHFTDLLGSTSDPVKRKMVMSLLLDEENKLGAGQEALDIAETRIAKGRKLIERQEALIARVSENGHDVRAHNDLLATLVKVQGAFERYRRTIMRGLNHRMI